MRRSSTYDRDTADAARDRVTGVPATERYGDSIPPGARSDEVEQEIRRTRARLGSTLDEIEHRLSPAHLKRNLKDTIDDTIADVRDQYNPKRMAKLTGDTMLDTVRDHPLAALTAGLSIGYLAIRGAADHRDGRSYERDRYRDYTGGYYGEARRGEAYMYGPGTYDSEEAYSDYAETAPRPYRQEGDASSEGGVRERAAEARERVGEGVEGARHRAEELKEESRERARELRTAASNRSRGAVRRVKRDARTAGNQFEHFIYENPLAAGALAVGIGAVVGGLVPSTDVEDRFVGPARDEVVDRARSVAEETGEQGKQAAERLAGEARHAAEDVMDKGKQEAKNVGSAAKESAKREASDTNAASGRSGASREAGSTKP